MFTHAGQIKAPIDLQTLVADAMAQHPDATRDELEAALVNGVETRIGRRLTEWEKAKVGVELVCQWNARLLAARVRDELPWPGGDVRGIPTFNDANRAAYDARAGKLS